MPRDLFSELGQKPPNPSAPTGRDLFKEFGIEARSPDAVQPATERPSRDLFSEFGIEPTRQRPDGAGLPPSDVSAGERAARQQSLSEQDSQFNNQVQKLSPDISSPTQPSAAPAQPAGASTPPAAPSLPAPPSLSPTPQKPATPTPSFAPPAPTPPEIPPQTPSPTMPAPPERVAVEGMISQAQKDAQKVAPDLAASDHADLTLPTTEVIGGRQPVLPLNLPEDQAQLDELLRFGAINSDGVVDEQKLGLLSTGTGLDASRAGIGLRTPRYLGGERAAPEATLADQWRSGVETLKQSWAALNAVPAARALTDFNIIDAGGNPEYGTGIPPTWVNAYRAADPQAREQMRERYEKALAGRVNDLTASAKRQGEIPRNLAANRMTNALNRGDWRAAWHAFMDDPAGIAQQFSVESLPLSSGALLAIPTGAISGVAGMLVGLAAGGFPADFSSSLIDYLQNQNVDATDANAVDAALRNPEFVKGMVDYATKHAIATTSMDVVGGKLERALVPGQLGRNVGRMAGNIALESLSEGAGEALGGGSASDVAAEMLGAGPQAGVITTAKTVAEGLHAPSQRPELGQTEPGLGEEPSLGTEPQTAGKKVEPVYRPQTHQAQPQAPAEPSLGIEPQTVEPQQEPALKPQPERSAAGQQLPAGKKKAGEPPELPSIKSILSVEGERAGQGTQVQPSQASAETPPSKQGGISTEKITPPSQPIRPFDMTPEQLQSAIDEKKLSDEDKLVLALGPERAKRFKQLDRAQNSSLPERADKAAQQFQAEFGNLTPEQERLIYGIGENDLSVEDLQALAAAKSDLTDEPISEVARVLTRGMMDASPDEMRKFISTGEGTTKVQTAAARVQNALTEFGRRGTPKAEIDATLLNAMMARGYSEADAREVLAEFLPKSSAAQTEPQPTAYKSRDRAKLEAQRVPASSTDEQTVAEIERMEAEAHQAAPSPQNAAPEPTEAQREAENFKMGHPKVAGIDLTVQYPEGADRTGKTATGEEWRRPVEGAHYGRIVGVPAKAADGEHIDFYLKPGTPEDFKGDVYVINQTKPDGSFDEPKAMIGYGSKDEAERVYKSNMPEGWNRYSGVATVPMEKFRVMLQGKSSFTKPVPGEVPRAQATETTGPLKAYTRKNAELKAKSLTKSGEPSQVIAHPEQEGKFAVVPRARGQDESSDRSAISAKPQQLFVIRGNQRFPVESLEDAADKWDQFRRAAGAGASEIGSDTRIVDQDGNDVARISYNGKVWPPGEWKPGMKPLVGEPFRAKTADEIDAERTAAEQPPIKENEQIAESGPDRVHDLVSEIEAYHARGQLSDDELAQAKRLAQSGRNGSADEAIAGLTKIADAVAERQMRKTVAGAKWWDGLTAQQKLDAAVKAGWSTAKGGPNFVAKRLARTAWADIVPGTRETLMRKNDITPSESSAAPIGRSITPGMAADKTVAAKTSAPAKVVERFAGQYGKGMTEFNARREMKRLAAEQPELDWNIESAPEFGDNRVVVVGREKGRFGTTTGKPVGRFSSLEGQSSGAEQALQDARRLTGLDIDVSIETIDDAASRLVPAYYDPARGTIVFNLASEATRAEAAQYVAEELLHAVDAVGPRRTLSARSTVIDQIIAPEANRHYDGGGEFAEFLDYPLNGEHGLTKSETKAELFARLGVLYFGDPDAMRRALPQTYEVFHDTFGFTETGPLGGGRILRQVQGAPAAQPRQAGEPTGTGERVSGGPAQGRGERRTDTGLERLRRQIVQHFATTPEGGIVQFSRYDAGHPEGFSDAYLAHQDEITQRIYDIARQLAPKADLQVVRQLFGRGEALIASGASTGAPREVAGMFNPAANLIAVSLRYENPEATVRHEAVHALKSMGLFTPTEWQMLERESRRAWMDKYGVTDQEEGIAYAFQDFRQGEPQKGFIGSAFRKIRDFLQRLANMLRGLGFQTPEDVFRRIERGEVGRRSLERMGQGKARYALAPRYRKGLNGPELIGERLSIVEPALWETRGDMRLYVSPIMEGDTHVGQITLGWIGEKATYLPDLRFFSRYQSKGNGLETIRSIVEHNGPGVELTIGYIAERARGFWRKMGARIEDTNEGTFGTITLESFRDAQARGAGAENALSEPEQSPGEEADRAGKGSGRTEQVGRYSLGTPSAGSQADQETRSGVLESYRRIAKKALGAVDRVFDPLATLPRSEVYLKRRYQTLGVIAKGDEAAKDIRKTFALASKEDKVAAFQYLTSAEASPDEIASPAIRRGAERVKELINEVGDGLVERGLLSEESRESYRDAYLPRLYLKYLLSEADWKALGAGKKPSDMGYLKQRKDIPEEVRRVILGEVRDPGFLSATAIAKPVRDMAILDWLESISQNKDWILPNSVVKYKKQKVSPYWLKEEAARLRKQADYYEPEDAEKARRMAAEMEKTADSALEGLPGDRKQFRQLPNTARYGRLRGTWVRKEIYDDISGVNDFLPTNPSFFQSLFGYGGTGTKLTQLWKMGKVALNPPAQVRNFVSNGALLQLSGVSTVKVPLRIMQAAREIINDGEHWKIAKKYGVTESTFAAQELYHFKKELLDLEREMGGLSIFGHLHRIGAIVGNTASNSYQMTEALFKTAKIIDAMGKGVDEATAALEAQKWLFDYSLVHKGVRYARSAPIGASFITFQVKVLPRLLEVAALHPQRFLPYALLLYGMQWMLAGMYDVNKDDLDRLKKALPEWLRERGHAMLLPWKDALGRWQAVDLGYFFPWSYWTDVAGDIGRGDVQEAIKGSGIIAGPLSALLTAVMTGVDSFTGREIIDPADPPQRQMFSLMNYLWSMAAPPFLTEYGIAGHMMRAYTGEMNRYGDPRSTYQQAALRLFGVNLYAMEPQRTRQSNIARMKFEIDEVKRRLSSLIINSRLEGDKRQALVDEYRAEMERRQTLLQEYMKESEINPKLLR